MNPTLNIAGRTIGAEAPVFIVAEISANHNQSRQQAIDLIRIAADCGADAVKLQTYTADSITLDCDRPEFRIGAGTVWQGRRLYDLYREAFTPWEWHEELFATAQRCGLVCFSSPFDPSAIDFLETLGAPAYKIASFEIVDVGLIRRAAATGKPLIMSTGMATLQEIQEAVTVARNAGCTQVALLKCTSAYPAAAEDMNLRTIPHLAETFSTVVGLSDHTLGTAVPAAAVALGARIIEKHITVSRSIPGPDSSFSLEPAEFRALVETVRTVECALGGVSYEPTEQERASRVFRRSLFAVKAIARGEVFTTDNIRSIRPSHGLHPRHLDEVIGRRATREIACGEPLSWDMVG